MTDTTTPPIDIIPDQVVTELKTRLATVPDTDQKDGYEAARLAIAECRSLWVSVEDKRSALVRPHLDAQNAINARAKKLTAELKSIAQPFQASKDATDKRKADAKAAAERAERERIIAIQNKVGWFHTVQTSLVNPTSEEIKQVFDQVTWTDVTESEYQEFTEQAIAARDNALANLNGMHRAAVEREHAAELEAERQRREYEQRAAEEERLRAEMEQQRAEIERHRAEAAAQMAAAQELAKQNAEAARRKQESESLAAEAERRADCEFAARQALVRSELVGDNTAAQILALIADGKVPYVRFDYSMENSDVR